MKKVNLNFDIKAVYSNLTRPGHVLISLLNERGNYLLGSKPAYYPHGIYRLVGGGMEKGETHLETAIRELEEEVHLIVNPEDLEALYEVAITATSPQQVYQNTTFIYQLNLKANQKLVPDDDIASLKELTPKGMKALINRYQNLSSDYWYTSGDEEHTWEDYGKLYGPIHQLVLEKNKNSKD